MAHDLADLQRELDLWAEAGRTASFWWRDDDAAVPAPALDRLLQLSETFGIAIGVAVIPDPATAALADALARHAGAVPLQHGYRHRNHGLPAAPAVECGGARPVVEAMEDLAAGAARMRTLFGEGFPDILAAPWNRIDPPVLDRLAAAGFRGASAFGPRREMRRDGLAVANAHVDPINWRERRFAGDAKALSAILGELRDRRAGAADPDEPLGLLTHHLDHDDDLWSFLERLFAVTAEHPAARWLTIAEAFAPAPAQAAA
jgi:hypothetical protein